MKILLYIIGGIAIVVLLFMGSCRALSKHIFNRQDCARFNIDNIEIRTKIDIPAITKASCACAPGTKDAEFTLNLQPKDLDYYINRNQFELKEGLFMNKHEDEYTRWTAVLDTSNQNLKIHLEYLK